MKAKTEVLVDPEQFVQMTSDEIAIFIRENKNTAIVGEDAGENRHIIRYKTRRDWYNYINPF
jgi:hypothetical protein